VKFCPSEWKHKCQAMRDLKDKDFSKKLKEGFRGMTILCIEDPWWKK